MKRITWPLLVARKCLLEMVRDWQMLLMMLLLPLAMLGVTWLGYGNRYRLATYTVLVQVQDARGERLVEQMSRLKYSDGRPAFSIQTPADSAAAEAALKSGAGALFVVFETGDAGELQVRVRGDATSMAFSNASSLLDRCLTPLFNEMAGRTQVIRVVETPLWLGAPPTEFDAYTPGMMVFAILFLIPQTAMLVGRELRLGTLTRLRLTRVRTWEYLTGISLAQIVLGAAQVLVTFAAARLMGFQSQGSLLGAVGICLLLAVSAIGMGLVVACFVENDSQALNTGATVSMVGVFISGAFFPMPAMTLFKVGSYPVGMFDWLPATHAMQALVQVLVGGAGLGQVWFRLAAVSVLSVFYFVLGVVIFNWLRMRRSARI